MAGRMVRDAASGSDPRRTASDLARRGRVVTALALAAVVGAGVWMVFDAQRSAAGRTAGVRLLTLERPFPAGGRYPSDPYVGPNVCAECHPGEFALYTRSGHSRTLRSAGGRSLARRLDGTSVADPEHADVLLGLPVSRRAVAHLPRPRRARSRNSSPSMHSDRVSMPRPS